MAAWALTEIGNIQWARPFRYFLVAPASTAALGLLSLVPFVCLRRRAWVLAYTLLFGGVYAVFFYDRAAPLYYVSPDYSGPPLAAEGNKA